MNPRRLFLRLLFFLISFIVVVNIISSNLESDSTNKRLKYFESFDLKLKGVICSIEKSKPFDSYKFFVTVNVLESNKKEFLDIGVNGAAFCMKKGNIVVFVDHFNNYSIGDTVLIGSDNDKIIECIDHIGKIKLIKRRNEVITYDPIKTNKKIKELLKKGCSRP
ncbi:hypothetical protein [Tenacibaculum amylolyticum]|uniref:hypothetical protein n=1 Tax=Tenacibaculum amylolyticum TaxID=104269 RepID=UPI0038953801